MHDVEIISPFPLYAVPRIWTWIEQTIGKKLDDSAPKTADEFLDVWVAAERQPGRRTWGVLRDGELGGVMFSNRLTDCVADFHVVFKREFFGHKTTLPAIAEALVDLFGEDDEGIIKIESKVLPENHAMLSMICAIGGAKEGLAKGHTRRRGKPIDVVMVGLERSKFYVWYRRKLQLEGYEQPVPEHVDDERLGNRDEPGVQAAGSTEDGTRHLRDAAPVPH